MKLLKKTFNADYDAKIKAYENFKVKFPTSIYNKLIDMRISELKEAQFMAKE